MTSLIESRMRGYKFVSWYWSWSNPVYGKQRSTYRVKLAVLWSTEEDNLLAHNLKLIVIQGFSLFWNKAREGYYILETSSVQWALPWTCNNLEKRYDISFMFRNLKWLMKIRNTKAWTVSYLVGNVFLDLFYCWTFCMTESCAICLW